MPTTALSAFSKFIGTPIQYLKRTVSVCYRGATCAIDCSPNFVVLVQPQSYRVGDLRSRSA